MNVKLNVSKLILITSILALGISNVKAVVPFENLPNDTVLAEVLDRKVYLRDIEPASDIKKKQQESTTNEQFTLWLKQTRASKLGRYFEPLWDEYAKEKGLEVTEQEINDYKERMANFMTAERKRFKIKKDNLAKELLAANLKDDKKAELEKSFKLNCIATSVKNLPTRNSLITVPTLIKSN